MLMVLGIYIYMMQGLRDKWHLKTRYMRRGTQSVLGRQVIMVGEIREAIQRIKIRERAKVERNKETSRCWR